MAKYVKTTKQDFVRDTQSKALLNTNTEDFKAYKNHRDKMYKAMKAGEIVEELQAKVAKLENLLEQMINNVDIVNRK